MQVKKTSMFAPFIVFGPAIMLQVGGVVYHGVCGLATGFGLFALGLLAWTLIEYLLHRFSFHSTSQAEWMKPFNAGLHLWHHNQPTSLDYIAAPIQLSIPVYGIFLGLMGIATRSLDAVLLAGTGVLAGYLFYEWVHYSAHLRNVKNPVMKYLKKYHMWHHFKDKENYFGVTSPLWDLALGTKPDSLLVPQSRKPAAR